MNTVRTFKGQVIQDWPLFQFLFNDVRAAWVWLPLRLWLGWDWLSHGLEKVSNPAWMQTGAALKAYWERAVTIPDTGRPPIAFDWYRAFIQGLLDAQSWTWFAPFVVYGEILVGIGLIVGGLTGFAAFFGGLMNWSFMMAGSASTNPMLFIAAIGLMMAWKVSGYIGADFFILRYLGTPWKPAEAPPASSSASASV